MFIPIGDTPNPRNFKAWMTWGIIAANVAIYVFLSFPLSSQAVNPRDPALRQYIQLLAPSLPPLTSLRQVLESLSAYDLFVFSHGYKPGAPQISDLFSSLFLHANFLHLFGNMLFLWIYGDNAEQRLGRFGFLAAYLATGAASTLFFALFARGSMMPLIGASGAISGVLGLYFLLFPRNQVKVFVALFPFFMNVVLLPARWVLGFYIVADNLLPFLLGAQSGVAYGAHIGGFLSGLVIAWIGEYFAWHLPWKNEFGQLGKASASQNVTDENVPAASRLGDIRTAIAQDAAAQAIKTLAKMDRQEIAGLRPNECVILAEWLEQAGHTIAATQLLRNCLAANPGASNLADVYLALGLMRLRQNQPTAAYQYLLSVFDYYPSPQTADRARQALAQIDVFRRE